MHAFLFVCSLTLIHLFCIPASKNTSDMLGVVESHRSVELAGTQLLNAGGNSNGTGARGSTLLQEQKGRAQKKEKERRKKMHPRKDKRRKEK
jgi:hypothetical protein